MAIIAEADPLIRGCHSLRGDHSIRLPRAGISRNPTSSTQRLPPVSMDHLTTEQSNPASGELDRLSPLEIATLMNREDARVAPAVASQLPVIAETIGLIADRLRAGGRLFYLGAGTSGRLGVLDASECPPTFQSDPGMVTGIIAGGPAALTRAIEGAEDQPQLAVADLENHQLRSGDVLVGIATSGRTPYVLGGLAHARSVGADTVAITCNPDSELQQVADRTIAVVVGPEVLSGSTRLKAGTATKMVLNMLSTGAMVRLGKTYGNLMVDLRASNQKLRERARRIVIRLTGTSESEAEAALASCSGAVKPAVVRLQRGLSAEAAQRALDQAGGDLRAALSGDQELSASAMEPQSDQTDGPWLVAGIDAGGSRTAAWVAPLAQGKSFAVDASGSEVGPLKPAPVNPATAIPAEHGTGAGTGAGTGEAGPGNPVVAGFDAAMQQIGTALDRALQQAGARRRQIRAAWVAVAGAGQPAMQSRILAELRRQGLGGSIEVSDDIQPVFAAAEASLQGPSQMAPRLQVALIAGTGSLAWGRELDEAGRVISAQRSGGWGPLLGDEGSGYAIARSALQSVCQSADGRRPPTALRTAILGALGLPAMAELQAWIHAPSTGRAEIARLAPLVLDLAGRDSAADEILAGAGRQLAAMVSAVLTQLQVGAREWMLVLSGGLLNRPNPLGVPERLAELGWTPAVVRVVAEPVAGCLQLARSLAKAPPA